MADVDVSVMMLIYNMERYPKGWFERAADSVFAPQLPLKTELIFADDASTDGTVDLLTAYMNQCKYPVGMVHTHTNAGGGTAANKAAEIASGRYFILLSMRSWYERQALWKMACALDKSPNIGFVYGQTIFHNKGEVVRTKIPQPFVAYDFKRMFASSFGYMYRREAWERGCSYDGCDLYIPEEGRTMTIGDYDFVMQMIFNLGWKGYCMGDTVCLHYEYGGPPQMNDLLLKYRGRIDQKFNERWGIGHVADANNG